MKDKSFRQRIRDYFKVAKEEAKRNIKLFPAYLLLAAILVFALKAVPDWLIIHVKPRNLNNDQAITYFCTIIVSFVTIVGIFLTLNHNQKMVEDQLKQNHEKFEEERRLNVLPVISIYSIGGDGVKNVIINFDEEAKEYEEFNSSGTIASLVKRIVITLTNEVITSSNDFSESQKLIPNLIVNDVNDNFSVRMLVYLLKNVGVGTAVNFKVSYFDNIGRKKDIKINPITLTPMQEVELYILFEINEDNRDEDIVNIEYSDIYENEYYQNHQITYKQEKSKYEISQKIVQRRKE